MIWNSAGAVIKLPRRVYSRNSEASVSNDDKIQQVIVTGRKLELESDSEILEGKANYINVRQNEST